MTEVEKIRTSEHLVALKRLLSDRITFDVRLRELPRPTFRASTAESLRSGWGFCGECARAGVLLLRAGGVRANRLYLKGEQWDHVVVEHEWLDGWVLFDAFPDPATLLPDELVGSIPSDALERFPQHEGNPWVDSYRLPGARFLGARARARPSPLITNLLEQPHVSRGSFAITAALGLFAAAGRHHRA